MKVLLIVSTIALLSLLVRPSFGLDLPNQIEQDRLYFAAQDFVQARQFTQAQIYLEKLKSIGTNRFSDFNFLYGKVLIENRRTSDGIFALKSWLKGQNNNQRKRPEYREALSLLTRVDRPSGYRSISRESPPRSVKTAFSYSGKGFSQEQWIKDLQQLYWTKTKTDTLVTHINTLLNTYQPKWIKEHVSVSTHSLMGKTRIQSKVSVNRRQLTSFNSIEEKYNGYVENIKRTPARLSVYGVDPELEYRCDIRYCFFLHPQTGDPFIFFEENEKAIRELRLSLASLIKGIQKGA